MADKPRPGAAGSQAGSNANPAKPTGLPRIPLPAKLFLSYALVVAIAAVPTIFYVQARLKNDLARDAFAELSVGAHRASTMLARLGAAERLERTQQLARMIADRVTLISPAGEVLFDSEVEASAMRNHRDRPEVQQALKGGEGQDERVSESTGKSTLYHAVRMMGANDEVLGVLRIARQSSTVQGSTHSFTSFTRNVQAAAISVAFGLSLLAAIQFMRPLQKVTASAKALAGGDFSARSGIASNDEVGDAGRAIDTIAVELRRRLASAGSADAVLAQLVDALPLPCVIFEVTGEVMSLNGAARSAFRVEGPNASRRLKELTSSPDFERALDEAEGDGEPEPIDVEVTPGKHVHAHVHVLKRPGVAPLYLLLGTEPPPEEATTLPPLDSVRTRTLADVVAEAREEAHKALERAGVQLEMLEPPSVMVVDVADRATLALTAVMEGCARGMAGRGGRLNMIMTVEETGVRLKLEADCGSEAVARVRPLVEPLGGSVRVDGGEAALWLPRA